MWRNLTEIRPLGELPNLLLVCGLLLSKKRNPTPEEQVQGDQEDQFQALRAVYHEHLADDGFERSRLHREPDHARRPKAL